MTRDEFVSNAVALVGGGHGWQTRLAERLGVDSRTVRRAIKDGPSDRLAAHLRACLGESAPQGIVAEWIVGVGDNGRDYLIHTRSPRFVCEIRPDGDESPEDDGVKYTNGDEVLCAFVWQDPMPDALSIWMERACDALDRIADSDDG